MRAILRQGVRSAVRRIARLTIFSPVRPIGILGFDALGARQSLAISQRPSKETFVVHTRDEIIGREVFLTGEFDFGKFVAAHEIVVRQLHGRRPKVLLDVGANIGTICIPAVARGYVERAIAIEPDPDNCRLLRANIALNGLGTQIVVKETAAGAADGESLQLELSQFNMGDHRIRTRAAGPAADSAARRSVTVRSSRLDTICADEPDDDLLLWMDVQGFEGYALTGGSSLLARKIPLVLEFWPGGMASAGSFDLVKSALSEYGAFLDLQAPARVRPIAELQQLFDEVGPGLNTTDIFVFHP